MSDRGVIGAAGSPGALSAAEPPGRKWLALFAPDGGEQRRAAIAGGAVLVCGLLLIRPGLVAADASMVTGGAAIALFLILWMTRVVPDYVAAVLFFATLAIVGEVPEEKIFAGFQSPAIWLVFGGLILGVAIKKSGLGNRIAAALLARVGHSYLALIGGIVGVGTVMTFVIPSAVGRMMLLLPLVTAIADEAGFKKGSNGRDGIISAICLSCFLPSYGVVTGSIPSITMFGSAEDLYGITFSYAGYLTANFPVLSVSVAVFLVVLIRLMFPATTSRAARRSGADAWSRDEKIMVAILSAALLFWFLDMLHAISPAWIGLAAGVACLSPRFGPARGTPITESVNFGVWFMLAAFISMGAVMKHSGLGTAIGTSVVETLEIGPGNDFYNFLSVVGISHLVNLATTQMSSPAIMAVLSHPIATAMEWPVEAVLLIQAASWSMPLLPVEIPLMAIGLGMGGVSLRKATRLLLALAVTGGLVILPAQFLWLSYLGIIP